MFTNLPIVPRCAGGIPRVFIFHRSSRLGSGLDEARGSLADFLRRADGLLDELCTGPIVENVLVNTSPATFDDDAALGKLVRAIDTRECDALIVESLSRISRDTRVLREFMDGLGQTGVRLLAIDDRFDSAVGSLPIACSTAPIDGSVARAAVALNGSS